MSAHIRECDTRLHAHISRAWGRCRLDAGCAAKLAPSANGRQPQPHRRRYRCTQSSQSEDLTVESLLCSTSQCVGWRQMVLTWRPTTTHSIRAPAALGSTGVAAPAACMTNGCERQPSARCPSSWSYTIPATASSAPMRGHLQSLRPSGLGPGTPGRTAHPLPAATRLPGRSYFRDLSGPGAGLLAILPILTARAAVSHEVQPRSSLQLVQYGRLHPDKMLANGEMG